MEKYLGEIRQFAGPFAPEGWAICDGSLLLVSEYPELFDLLGHKFGSEGTAKFALPDLRGRAVISRGQGKGLQNYPFGSTGGSEKVILAKANIPAHKHDFFVTTEFADSAEPAADTFLTLSDDPADPNPHIINVASANTKPQLKQMDDSTLSPSGSTNPAAHENRMPYVAINFIICIAGTYPDFKE